MGSIVMPQYDYGHPKNPDYAYDVERQRRLEIEIEADMLADEFNAAWAALVETEV